MTHEQCENLYEEHEMGNTIQLCITDEKIDIIDIKEDAHRGWICVIDEAGSSVGLKDIDVADIMIKKCLV